jgi:hypothetical protein
MKLKIATALFSIASVIGFTDEGPINQPSANLSIDLKAADQFKTKQSFGYVFMTIADPDLTTVQTIPGIGLGYRYGLPQSAIDVSANYTRETRTADQETFNYRIPVSYFRYVSNDAAPQSFYYGAGLGWAGGQKEGIYVNGLDASATVGYEMYRTQNIHSFVQMDVSHAAVNVSTASVAFQKVFAPRAQFAVGFGF